MAIVVLPQELVFKKYTLVDGQVTEGYTFEDWYFKSEDGVETLVYKDLVIRREACLQDVIYIPKRIRGRAAYLLRWARKRQHVSLSNIREAVSVGETTTEVRGCSNRDTSSQGCEGADRPLPDTRELCADKGGSGCAAAASKEADGK